MFIEIATAVTTGILTAAGILAAGFYIKDNWDIWFGEPKIKNVGGKQLKVWNTPYDPTSPLVKKFQYLAGIADRDGNLLGKKYDYNYRYARWY